MTNNEQIKCPVCGCDTCIETGYNNQSLPICQKCGLPYEHWGQVEEAKNKAAQDASQFQANLDYLTVKDSETIQEALERLFYDAHPLQKIIDKEKAAAVIAERERVDKDLNQMELFYQDNCPQSKLSCHATILSTVKEARKIVTKGIQQFNVT